MANIYTVCEVSLHLCPNLYRRITLHHHLVNVSKTLANSESRGVGLMLKHVSQVPFSLWCVQEIWFRTYLIQFNKLTLMIWLQDVNN